VDQTWYREQYIPRVAKRGAEIIQARGSSSAASAGFAGLQHMRDWALGSAEGDWVSMGIPSDGSYGISEGLIYGFPVTCKDGNYEIVQGLDLDEFSRSKLAATEQELKEERDAVKALL
jgi:malate dehydrogenase